MNNETMKNVEYEKKCQKQMDLIYSKLGWEVINRRGTKKYDCILEINGKKVKIEEKFRRDDFGDIFVELIQDLVSGDLGWFYCSDCQYLSYVIAPIIAPNNVKIRKIFIFNFFKFKEYIINYLKTQKTLVCKIAPGGWGITLNLPMEITEEMKRSCLSKYYELEKGEDGVCHIEEMEYYPKNIKDGASQGGLF